MLRLASLECGATVAGPTSKTLTQRSSSNKAFCHRKSDIGTMSDNPETNSNSRMILRNAASVEFAVHSEPDPCSSQHARQAEQIQFHRFGCNGAGGAQRYRTCENSREQYRLEDRALDVFGPVA